MREVATFREFFDKMGVAFDADSSYPRYEGGSVLSVSQAHFQFDAEGRFRGVVADEMGYFDPREGPLPEGEGEYVER